jgi:hypothetical protein
MSERVRSQEDDLRRRATGDDLALSDLDGSPLPSSVVSIHFPEPKGEEAVATTTLELGDPRHASRRVGPMVEQGILPRYVAASAEAVMSWAISRATQV